MKMQYLDVGSKSLLVGAMVAIFLCSSFPHIFASQASCGRGDHPPIYYAGNVPFRHPHHGGHPTTGGFSNHADTHPKPSFIYEYGVADEFTGDMKTVYEQRDGNIVQGGYKFLQPDGILRVVTYTSDPVHGFRTKVQMLNGLAVHPLPLAASEAVRYPQGQPLSGHTNHVPIYNPQAAPPGLTRFVNPRAKRRKFNGKTTRRIATIEPLWHQNPSF